MRIIRVGGVYKENNSIYGSAPPSKAFGRTTFLYLQRSCSFGFVTRARETQQFEQLDVKCTALIICHRNKRVGVPMCFEDREWRHNL